LRGARRTIGSLLPFRSWAQALNLRVFTPHRVSIVLLDRLASSRVALLLRALPETGRLHQPLAPGSGPGLLSGSWPLQRSRPREHVFWDCLPQNPAHRVSHPLGGLQLPRPSCHVSDRWRSWGSYPVPASEHIQLRMHSTVLSGLTSPGFSPAPARTTFDRCLPP